MISPTECGSRSDTYRVTLDTQESSQNTECALSKMINICNLPVELKQKIAFNLDSKDYASLRATGKIMSESLDSFSVMNNKLTHGKISRYVEKNIREIMCDNLIRNLLGGNQTKEITLSLKNCFSRPHPILEGNIQIGTEYLPDSYKNTHPDRICKVVDLCRNGITSFIPCGESRAFRPDLFPGELWNVAINFKHSEINLKYLNDIFSSFNKVYRHTEDTEKFVVANLASTLRNYWAETPPIHVNKKDIVNLSVAYPELFHAGDNVVKVIRESIQ
ncbi:MULTISPECIES: hypothetical protein [Symbiopectobacterium]|uniref:hypothetical protein n=1 Tax=Symbiopectobacterium TaxID=801 RepID=UPI001A2EE605|nr:MULTISPECIES: hypothetical protein [Symbiopectobacterium]MBG6248315.1 hypothetical protein [Candidatus Symbiopectobacterium sp. PLON1]MBT9429902.1 hypothetical protein [Candidatus Symbiopectobacterium endolongispinus]